MGQKKRETQSTVQADQKIPCLINVFWIIFLLDFLFFALWSLELILVFML